MPHYYFRLWRGPVCEDDLEGMELPDIHAAQAEAVRVIRELREDWAGRDPQPLGNLAFEILDGRGRRLLTVPFAEAAAEATG